MCGYRIIRSTSLPCVVAVVVQAPVGAEVKVGGGGSVLYTYTLTQAHPPTHTNPLLLTHRQGGGEGVAHFIS